MRRHTNVIAAIWIVLIVLAIGLGLIKGRQLDGMTHDERCRALYEHSVLADVPAGCVAVFTGRNP